MGILFARSRQLRYHRCDGPIAISLQPNAPAEWVPFEKQTQRDNPQAAARLVSAFNQWKRFDAEHQALMQAELKRIIETKDLVRDVFEIVKRALE